MRGARRSRGAARVVVVKDEISSAKNKAEDVFPSLAAERARRVAAPIYLSHLGISIVFGDVVQIVDYSY